MNFLNPFILFGLAAASIPILLHLINLRKQKNIEFSSLKFLKELQKTRVKKLKLKQILLLILRTLLIIFAVLAFARPTIESTIPGFTSYSNTSGIILIDNSFSMDLSDENGNRFRKAKDIAGSILSEMKEGDEYLIIDMASPPPLRSFNWSSNKNYLQEKVDNINIANSTADLNTTIKYSSQLLDEAKNLNKVIYLVSDLQDNILSKEDTTEVISANAGLLTFQIGKNSEKEIENLSIDTVNVESTIIQKEKPIDLKISIRNHTNKNFSENLVSIYFNEEKVAQRTYNTQSKSVEDVFVSAPYSKSGIIKGKVEIENDDILKDNSYYFTLYIPEEPEVIIAAEKENFYLNTVLENLKKLRFIKTYRYVNNLKSMGSINSDDIIIFAMNNYKNQDIINLREFINAGGKTILFQSEERSEVNKELIAKLGIETVGVNNYTSYGPVKFEKVDRQHPIFSGVFKGETNNNKIVESPEIISAAPSLNGRRIIEISKGGFLSEHTLGNGVILYIAVPINNDWSNLPLTGIFPALTYKSLAYLNKSNTLNSSVTDGENIFISKEATNSNTFKIIDPDNKEIFADAAELKNRYILELPEDKSFGNYIVYNNSNKPVAFFNINPDSDESKVDIIEEHDFISKMEKLGFAKDDILLMAGDNDPTENLMRAKIGTELWQLFILLALMCGMAELVVQRLFKDSK